MNVKAIFAAAALAGAGFVAGGALAQDDPAEAARQRFEHMSQVARMFSQTTDPTERRELMQQHRALMQQQMEASGGMMMGGGMMGGMHSGQTGGMGHQGMMSDGDMSAMSARMTMMQDMMMQMMNQQNMMMQMQEDEAED